MVEVMAVGGGGARSAMILAVATGGPHNVATFNKSGCQSWGGFPVVGCCSTPLFFPHF
jgi:hypothetical protein